MFKIPFSLLPTKALQELSKPFLGIAQKIGKHSTVLETNLIQADIKISKKEYIAMCFLTNLIFFIFSGIMFSIILFAAKVEKFYIGGIVIALIFLAFAILQQSVYPKFLANKKIKAINKNLLPALQSILVQFNSGIPLFDILVNISKSDYGAVSGEFLKAVREINAGKPQIAALEEIATKNPSLFFRRAIWQIVNGMRAGADISDIMEEAIYALSEEQLIQVQNYGSQLNPLAMFYMLIAVIIPALSVTLIIVLASFIALEESALKAIFWGLYAFIVFMQIMFLGLIKSRRPQLLGE